MTAAFKIYIGLYEALKMFFGVDSNLYIFRKKREGKYFSRRGAENAENEIMMFLLSLRSWRLCVRSKIG